MARNIKISLCYYPTTVVVIDDNPDYASQVGDFLNQTNPFLIFINPIEALNYLNKEEKEKTFFDRSIALPEYEESESFSPKGTIKNIEKEMFFQDRFSQINILVVDYTILPEMNGIEFCKKLNRKNFRIILLTGDADERIANDAFNEGIIAKYIKKSDPEIISTLLKAIKSLELSFFLYSTNTLMSQANPFFLTSLEDNFVSDLFYKLVEKNDIREYYILSKDGDFILFNNKDDVYLFSVKSEEDLFKLYDYAILCEDNPSSKLEDIKNKKKVPLFSSSEDIKSVSPEEWNLYPINPIPGSEKYFFAYEKISFPFREKGVVLLNDYLKARTSI